VQTPAKAPVVGVGAVVFKDGKVLMMRRANDPGAGRWSIPGGRLEFGETTEHGARREVREETGVSCAIEGLIGVYDAVIPGGDGRIAQHFTLVNYAARWVSDEPRAGGDALETAFMDLETALGLDLWGEVRAVIEKGCAFYANRG